MAAVCEKLMVRHKRIRKAAIYTLKLIILVFFVASYAIFASLAMAALGFQCRILVTYVPSVLAVILAVGGIRYFLLDARATREDRKTIDH